MQDGVLERGAVKADQGGSSLFVGSDLLLHLPGWAAVGVVFSRVIRVNPGESELWGLKGWRGGRDYVFLKLGVS